MKLDPASHRPLHLASGLVVALSQHLIIIPVVTLPQYLANTPVVTLTNHVTGGLLAARAHQMASDLVTARPQHMATAPVAVVMRSDPPRIALPQCLPNDIPLIAAIKVVIIVPPAGEFGLANPTH
ncbi:hypothetical protein VTN49DRAFT_5483 [Thermomyces lanuginosus]|uniref:uncharacterized protein n=1 Tax=Thermomyces lanuginosus TaxID=5541 RepID=UPI003742C822